MFLGRQGGLYGDGGESLFNKEFNLWYQNSAATIFHRGDHSTHETDNRPDLDWLTAL